MLFTNHSVRIKTGRDVDAVSFESWQTQSARSHAVVIVQVDKSVDEDDDVAEFE